MKNIRLRNPQNTKNSALKKRLGAVLVMAALFLIAILGFTSFTVDVDVAARHTQCYCQCTLTDT